MALLDTGCSISCISTDLARQQSLTFSPVAAVISGAFLTPFNTVRGITNLIMAFKTSQGKRVLYSLNALVIDDLTHPIFIGNDFLTGPHVSKLTDTALFLSHPYPVRIELLRLDLSMEDPLSKGINLYETPQCNTCVSQPDPLFEFPEIDDIDGLLQLLEDSDDQDHQNQPDAVSPPPMDNFELIEPSAHSPPSSTLPSTLSDLQINSAPSVMDDTSEADNIFLLTSHDTELEPFEIATIQLYAKQHEQQHFGKNVEMHMFNAQRQSFFFPITLNCLSNSGDTTIKITNNSDAILTLMANIPVARVIRKDLHLFNESAAHYLQHISLLHEPKTHLIDRNVMETIADQINSARVDLHSSVPMEFDIKQRKSTISDQDLLNKFDFESLTPCQKQKIQQLILDFRPIWSEHPYDLGLHKYVQQNIELEKPLPPCPKQRIWPRDKQQAAEKLIDTLEQYGIISKSNSNWATNVILVAKAPLPSSEKLEKPLLEHFMQDDTKVDDDLKKFRLVLDLRPTNSVMKNDVTSMGNMDNLLSNISMKPIRSSFDISQAFYQIGLTPESQGCTFFVTRPSGSVIMRFNRSIQGSKTATSVFTRAMEVTLQGLAHAASHYVDDLLVHSSNQEQHLFDLKQVFARLLDSNMKLSPAKAKFFSAKITYLGMEITGPKFSLSRRKLDSILKLPPPTNKKMLESQFALMQYYKKFIPNFSDLTNPFRKLLSSKSEFHWTPECEKARTLLINIFATNLALTLPDHSKKFRLATDASSFAIAAVLSQKGKDDDMVPVAFYSKSLDDTQLRYSILDKELYAMINSIRHFDFYLSGKPFDLITDSKCLFYLKHAKENNPKLYRWSLLLQSYDFTLIHVNSKQNLIPDILTRQNEILQKESRTLHMAKKDILDNIRTKVKALNIPDNTVMSSKDVTKLLAECSNTPPDDRIEASINHVREDLEKASILSAISFQPGALSLETLAKLQSEDTFCKSIIDKPPPHFTVRKGLLLRIRNDSDHKLVNPQLVLPEILIDMVIKLEHTKNQGVHLPHGRVFKTISAKYFFPKMAERIKDHVHKCFPCQLMAYHTKPPHKLSMYDCGNQPRQAIGLDLAVELPPVRTLKHVLLVVDYGTNYVQAYPLSSRKSIDILKAFKQYVSAFGIPHLVRHDQELGFTGAEFAAFCNEHNIEQVQTLPYKSNSNGRTEVQVRNFKHMLQKSCLNAGDKTNWPDHIWKVVLGLNTSVSLAFDRSPEELLFGTPLLNKTTDIAMLSYSSDPEKLASQAHTHRSDKQLRQLERNNKHKRVNSFSIGDLVLRKIIPKAADGSKHALDTKFQGPFTIIDKTDTTCTIQPVADNFSGTALVHPDHLKPFHTTSTPALAPSWNKHIAHRLNMPHFMMLFLTIFSLMATPLAFPQNAIKHNLPDLDLSISVPTNRPVTSHLQTALRTKPTLDVHTETYKFNSELAHKGGLIFKQTNTRIKIKTSTTSLTQPIELEHLVQDVRDWNIYMDQANDTFNNVYSDIQNITKSDYSWFSDASSTYKSDLWKTELASGQNDLNRLHNTYITDVTDLLETYNKMIPSTTDITPYKARHRRLVKLLIPLLKAVKPLATISTPLSLLSKTGTAISLGHVGYELVKAVAPQDAKSIATSLALKLGPKIAQPAAKHAISHAKPLLEVFYSQLRRINNIDKFDKDWDFKHKHIATLFSMLTSVHDQQDEVDNFQASLASILATVASNTKSLLADKQDKLKASKTLLQDIQNKKSVSQSTLLKHAFQDLISQIPKAKNLLDKGHESIIPRLSFDNKQVLMEYPIDIIDPNSFDTFVSQMVPFETDQGNWISHLPSIFMIQSDSTLHYVYASDLRQCHQDSDWLTCPKAIINRPNDNICFRAHIANNIDAIQSACDLQPSTNLNTMIELQKGIIYYDLPQHASAERHCATLTNIPLQGNGLITIPYTCSLNYKLKSFFNDADKVSVQAQQILQILPETLTHPEYVDSLWNRSKDSIGIASLATIISITFSLLITQCANILTHFGVWKTRQLRKHKTPLTPTFLRQISRMPSFTDDQSEPPHFSNHSSCHNMFHNPRNSSTMLNHTSPSINDYNSTSSLEEATALPHPYSSPNSPKPQSFKSLTDLERFSPNTAL
jgi:hypothetical protein